MNEYGCHPLPYISDEISNPKPHSFMTLLPCKVSPSKLALSLQKIPFFHDNAVDLVKFDRVKVFQPLFTHKGAQLSC